MKKVLGISAITVLSIVSCSTKRPKDILIEGYTPQVKSGMVYLTDAYHWKINIDSAEMHNGNFSFHIKNDSSFSPFVASLYYYDSEDKSIRGSISFTNTSSNAFYVEPGTTKILGREINKAGPVHPYIKAELKSGRQNAVFEKNLTLGYIADQDSVKRATKITWLVNKIKQTPYSFYFLDNIYAFRSFYSKKELVNFFDAFEKDVRNSSAGVKFSSYLSLKRDGITYRNVSLPSSKNSLTSIINNNCALNMLVFWASWCKPCRQEIPTLKKFYEKYKSPELNLISISVDTDEDAWRKALEEEKMPWDQCIIRDSEKIIDASYDIAAVPLIVFTDRDGNEIKRFVGSDEKDVKEFEKIILKAIPNN